MKRLLKNTSALAMVGLLSLPAVAQANEVTLKSNDGTVNMVGEYVDFQDNSYIIRTGLGELRVSAERVRCEGDACPVFETATADVVISGAETLGQGLMPLLLQGWAGSQGADSVVTSTSFKGETLAELIGDQGFGDTIGTFLVSSSSSAEGFEALLDASSELAMSSRRIRPAEARALREAGAGNMIAPEQEHIIAVDSLVVIVHPDNPVQSLRMDQLAAIFAGQITNWSEVGGDNAPIVVHDRAQDSDARRVFANAIAGDDLSVAPTANVVTGNEAMANAVTGDKNAIGFVGYAFKRGAKPVSLVNECGLTKTPDSFSARTEEYPLQRRLYLYNRADTLSDEAQALVNYAKSEDADEVIQKAGFIGLGIDKRPQRLNANDSQALLENVADAYEAQVVRDMISIMEGYERLSSTFRFTTGSSRLDERAVLDMERLATYLENKPAGTKVLFVGFTDNVGAFDSNRNLSARRAAQVMNQLQTYAGARLGTVEVDAIGFGEIAPSACNFREAGRRINRRVEVWISQPGLL